MTLGLEPEDSVAWWLADQFNKQPHDLLGPYIQQLISDQSGRFENMRRMIAAYERGSRHKNRDDIDESVLTDNVLSFNHARNGVDTVHCKWIKSETTPMVLTNGGGAIQRDRAKNLEKAVTGELDKNDWNALEEQSCQDALVCGLGWIHVLHGQPTLTVDWVPSEDVIFDPAETRQKKPPRFIARRFLMDKYVAMARWGEKEDGFYSTPKKRIAAIRKCKMANATMRQRDRAGNVIEVFAAFHQGSGEDAGDGKYCVIIDGATMEYSEWDRDYLPLIPLVAFPRMRQLHGLSLMADFLPVQQEHDKLSGRIQKAHHQLGGTHLIALRGANIDIRELNNAQGTVIEADADAGPDPVREFNPTPVNPATYQYREGLIAEMYRAKGIDSMSAQGQVPEGMQGSSGKALQVAEDSVSERLLIPFRMRDRHAKKVWWCVIEEARAMVESDSNYSVKYRGERRALQKIKWKDVLIDRDDFDLDIFPVNELSKNPTAKFAQLTELLKAGAIQTEQFRRLYGLPDLEAENEVDLADIEIIDMIMDEIIIEGKALQPEAFDYLKLVIQRGRKFYNLCRKKKIPEERLSMLRDYLLRAKEMDDAQTAANAALAQPPLAQAMPGGAVGPVLPPGSPPLPAPNGAGAPAPM